MEKVRDLHNCSKCGVGFRPSAEQEVLCSKCQVSAIPNINDPAEVERQFLEIAGKVYGTQSTEKLFNIFGIADVFNHKQRLQKLMDDLEKSNSRNKDRIKRRREINRLMEEHDAVQKALADIQTKFLRKMMLDPDMQFLGTSRSKSSAISPPKESSHTSPRTPPQKVSDSNNNTPVRQVKSPGATVGKSPEVLLSPSPSPKKTIKTGEQIQLDSSTDTLVASPPTSIDILPASLPSENSPSGKKKSPVKKFAEYFEKRSKLGETAHAVKASNSFKSNQPFLQTVKEGLLTQEIPSAASKTQTVIKDTITLAKNTPTPKEPTTETYEPEDTPQTPDLPDEEVFGTEFKRSNSVRDRIKGYEERIRRTVSTGSSDRPAILKRQLF